MKIKDIPMQWQDRCSGDGNEIYVDNIGERRYKDNDELITEDAEYRPCGKCGEYPTEDGDDACLGELTSVVNACCGHGRHKGYIQFDNGITIRGKFEIERGDSFSIEHEMRSRQDVLERIEELETEFAKGVFDRTVLDIELGVLKWIMKIQ